MKILKLFRLLLFFSIVTNAQEINYKIAEDNPNILSERYLNLELLGVDLAFDFNEAPIFIGANGFYKINDKLKAEALVRLHLFNMVGSGIGTHIEAGVFMPLKKTYKSKDVKVITSSKYGYVSDRLGNNTRSATTTNYFTTQGKYLNQLGVRGGLYYRNSVYYEDSNTGTDIDAKYNTFGLYLGAEKISQAFVKALVGNSTVFGQGRTRMYLDALILPVQSIENNIIKKDEFLGYRAGFQWQVKPVKGGWFKPIYNAEIGSRPYTGFYMQVSIGISLMDL